MKSEIRNFIQLKVNCHANTGTATMVSLLCAFRGVPPLELAPVVDV